MPIQEIGVLFVYLREEKKNGFFIFESDNGKFWVELSGRRYFSEGSSDLCPHRKQLLRKTDRNLNCKFGKSIIAVSF